jgi:hypothetical protein
VNLRLWYSAISKDLTPRTAGFLIDYLVVIVAELPFRDGKSACAELYHGRRKNVPVWPCRLTPLELRQSEVGETI